MGEHDEWMDIAGGSGAAVAAAVLLATAGCGDNSTPDSSQSASHASSVDVTPSISTSTADPEPPPAIVGLWTQTHSCQELQKALADHGLAPTTPSTIADYFPGRSAAQIARKADPCAGASPEQHSHFFAADGEFGSLDQDGHRVDDGSWSLVAPHRLQIGQSIFAFTISHGQLTLRPVIKAADRKAALQHPLEFSDASWQVAVSYGGKAWRRADCGTWCD